MTTGQVTRGTLVEFFQIQKHRELFFSIIIRTGPVCEVLSIHSAPRFWLREPFTRFE
jgi:hypothetical protein